MRRFFRKFLGLGVALFLLVISGLWILNTWGHRPMTVEKAKAVYFPKNTRLGELSGLLESSQIVSSGVLFNVWVRIFGDYSKFQAGRYQVVGGVTPNDVAVMISSGKVHRPILLQVTIPEGFTLNKVLNRLEAKNIGTKSDMRALSRNSAFLRKLGVKAPSLEGFLYPATYSFYHRPSAREVLRKMVQNFFANVPKSLIRDLKAKRLSLREATAFASLIELETQHESEKPMVAEVIWRRLKRREPLGIDASVIYGIKNFDGDLTWDHLGDRKNPYNTRIHKGLPPGPIGSPAASSFRAILNPTNEGYYYYVLVADGRKRHHFSKTLVEHNRYVKKLLKASRGK